MKSLLKRTARLAINFFFPKPPKFVIPHPSPIQTIKQNFGLGIIELNYSRPGIKGRKVFGDMVPFGQLWRPGANEATTLDFNDEVIINGTTIKPGKYSLLSIPNVDEWTLIITKDLDVHNFRQHKTENEMVRIKAKPMVMESSVETFTIQFANIRVDYCEIHITWENTAVAFPITNNSDSLVLKHLENSINAAKKSYFTYYHAARYFVDNDKDLKKADSWIDQNLALPDNELSYYTYMVKARISQKLGNKEAAEKAALKTIEIAANINNDDYVRMANDILKKLKQDF